VTAILATSFSILAEDGERVTLRKFVLRVAAVGAAGVLLMAAGAQAGAGVRANAGARTSAGARVSAAASASGPTGAGAGARTRSQEHQALGSLSSVGQVSVNNSAAPADATIFGGDVIRTGANGTATFTSSAEGSFQMLAGSQIAFNGGEQYAAELQAGTVVMSSQRGTQGLSTRIEGYTVVGASEGEQATSKVERAADGSFTVTCLGGSVILVPTGEGSSGVLIQSGQMVTISARGKLSTVKEAGAVPPATPSPTPAPVSAPASAGISNTTKWIIAGVAIAGGAGAALALAGGHKSSSVSPATP
jgi:hypothetical protein